MGCNHAPGGSDIAMQQMTGITMVMAASVMLIAMLEYGPAMMMIRMCYRVSISTDLISMAATIAGRATNRSSPPALVLANRPRSNVHSANTSINYANYFSTASAEERPRPKGSQLTNRPPTITIPGSSSRRTSSNHCTNTSTNYTLPIDL
jgi:hypothetical protein